MINPEVIKRLQLLSKDIYSSDFSYDPFLVNESDGALKGLPKKKKNSDFINLIFALIKNECSFSQQFWNTYVYSTVASTKLNSTLSVDSICKLIEITQDRFKKTKSAEDEDLLLELIDFISTNSLLSNANNFISSINRPGMLAQQTINKEFFEETISRGRDLLLQAILLLYGVATPKTRFNSINPTKKQLKNLQDLGLIDQVNYEYLIDDDGYSSWLKESVDNREKIVTLDHLGYLHETEMALRIFINRMAYVRVDNAGEYLPKFDELWDFETAVNRDKKNVINKLITKNAPSLSGLESYNAVIDSIKHIQDCLKARGELCNAFSQAYPIKNLKLVAGLDNIKSIKNEITQGNSLLQIVQDDPELVTKDSAMKWLNDPKRRKAKFYSFLEEYADPSIDNLKEIYTTELNS